MSFASFHCDLLFNCFYLDVRVTTVHASFQRLPFATVTFRRIRDVCVCVCLLDTVRYALSHAFTFIFIFTFILICNISVVFFSVDLFNILSVFFFQF